MPQSQLDKHLKWCLNDPKRLIKTKPNMELARRHIKKSERNYKVAQTLETLKFFDWALNVGFYSIYHCFLAILAKHGYESRNQACTITVMLALIDEKKIELDMDLVTQFDTLDVEKSLTNPTIRESREVSTYGVETSINLKELKRVKELIIKVQRETIKIVEG